MRNAPIQPSVFIAVTGRGSTNTWSSVTKVIRATTFATLVTLGWIRPVKDGNNPLTKIVFPN